MDAVNSIKETESDYHEASVADQSMYYPVNNCYGYYYPGLCEPSCFVVSWFIFLTPGVF